jgi:hypothetical protein
MKSIRHGLTVRSLCVSAFASVGALLSMAASADVYYGISNTQKLAAVTEPFNQAAGLRLGTQVAAAGGQVLSVGGNAVYAFQQNTQGAWTQTAKLTAFDSGVLTGPIAFDGTYALIRGYMPDQTSVVYAYMYDAGRWRSISRLKGTTGFGESIALEGCTALISSASPEGGVLAPNEKTYVHFFDRCRTGSWTWINSFSSPAADRSSNRFGASIALTGSEALIGAPDLERVYYYVRSGDSWQLRQTLTGTVSYTQIENKPLIQNKFGSSIARLGNLALIRMAKEYAEWTDSMAREGIVLQFTLANGVWTQTGQMEPIADREQGFGWDLFGDSIVLTPDWAFISAPGNVGMHSDVEPREQPGGVYAFPRKNGGFAQAERLGGFPYQTGPEGDLVGGRGQLGSYFGQDIAVMGNTLVVGWPLKRPDDVRLQLKTGATAVYQIPPPPQ